MPFVVIGSAFKAVIASKAKQSSARFRMMDCFVAYAPRNDEG
jgi:hypothetical protein